MNKVDPTTKTLAILVDYKLQKEEAELYMKLSNKTILLPIYFQEQRKLDELQRRSGVEIGWEDLKKKDIESYKHEMLHHKVWQKYGVKTALFYVPNTKNGYFVMDLDFGEVALKNKYSIEKVISILKEMLRVSFIDEKEIKHAHILDLFFYEILAGNIKRIHAGEINNAYKKYHWCTNDFIAQ